MLQSLELHSGRGRTKRFSLPSSAIFSIIGAAGIAQTEHFGDLVKGFAGGVVNGGAEAFKISDAFND